MKQYGFNQATEFTRKQINVVYALAKSKKLLVEKWVISDLYELSEYYGIDFNATVEMQERFILNILKSVFAKDYKKAQERINRFTEFSFKTYTQKAQLALNREYL